MKNQVKSIIAQMTFLRKIYRKHYLSPCRNHSPSQKVNLKNKSGTECTALQRVLKGPFHAPITT